MRKEYGSGERDGSPDLDVDWLDDGWLALLRKWIGDAERGGVAEPNAMVLATVKSGRPVSRSVLCKGVDEDGITFFTNYDSAKGDELAATPYASATFPWYLLNRQFHIRGPVTKVDPQDTENYWSKRPRGSQLGAWASHQSRPIASRAALVDQLGRGDGALRRLRADPGSAELGRLPHRARRGGVLAGSRRPAAQPNSCGRRTHRTPAALGGGVLDRVRRTVRARRRGLPRRKARSGVKIE